jgi:hypothetical protein
MLQDLTDEEEILRRAFQFFDKVGITSTWFSHMLLPFAHTG